MAHMQNKIFTKLLAKQKNRTTVKRKISMGGVRSVQTFLCVVKVFLREDSKDS